MISIYSPWLAAHGKLWYDDKWYRLAWAIWPQALAMVLVLFWAMPSSVKNVPWAKPIDASQRARQLQALRDSARSSHSEMELLERDARGGEALAQFFYATLFDPDLKLSTITPPDIGIAIDWYSQAAAQGDEWSASNLATTYAAGMHVRADNMRACQYARKLRANGFPGGFRVKGDCYARGLGGTPIDLAQAADAYEAAFSKGNVRAGASLGYFYENGLGNRPRNLDVALKYYRVAADKGDALGLHNLGAAYNSGLLGLQRDGTEAARLVLRALDTRYDVTVQSLVNHPDLWTPEFWLSLQRRLAERGVYSGPIHGRANPAILEAVKRFGRS
jgi:hypothetical protein